MTGIQHCHDVLIVGAGRAGICTGIALLQAGITDFVLLEQASQADGTPPPALGDRLRRNCEVITSVFDDATDTWTVTTRGGATRRARVVIAAHRRTHVPWIPELPGRNSFRGKFFHSAAADRDFDPAGKRIALLGTDSAAGEIIRRLRSAASVKVFAHPPRRIVAEVRSRSSRAKSWLRQPRSPELVASTVDTLTVSGIRTRDGVDHDVDAVICATGFAVAESFPSLIGVGGITIQQAWRNGMEPYMGVAVHGFPNYFLVSRPDAEAQVRHVSECLRAMKRTAATRIEVRRSSQQVFNERVHRRRPPWQPVLSAFDLATGANVHDHSYAGPATLTIAGTDHQVRVRLTGHVDPIDGKYHWQGTIFDQLSAQLVKNARAVALAAGEESKPARITEETPQGTHSVAGVGAPPFALEDIKLVVPQL